MSVYSYDGSFLGTVHSVVGGRLHVAGDDGALLTFRVAQVGAASRDFLIMAGTGRQLRTGFVTGTVRRSPQRPAAMTV